MAQIGDYLTKTYIMQTNNFRPKYNAEKVYRSIVAELTKLLAESGVTIELNPDNKHVMGQLALWFSNDERFESDLRKGIMIKGGVGTGKTKIVQALKKTIELAQQDPISFIHATDLQELYTSKREEEIAKHKVRKLVIVDDLGVECVETKHFGNVVEPFNDLFDYRYRHGKQTVITTNLIPDKIRLMYGDRIADRFRETIYVLTLDGKSLRK